MKLRQGTPLILVGVALLAISACAPQPPPAPPVLVKVTQASGTTVTMNLEASPTTDVAAYRFILRPVGNPAHPEIVFDQIGDTNRSKTFTPADWLPADGTPYEVVGAVVKGDQTSAETKPAATHITVTKVYHPEIPGTAPVPGATATDVEAAETAIANEMVNAVNAERALRGMSTLTQHALPAAFADMVSERNAAALQCTTPSIYGSAYPNTCHATATDENTFWPPLYPFVHLGENSLEGSTIAPLNVVVAWMNSGGHRNAILDNRAEFIGMGIACDSRGQAWILMDTGKWATTPPSTAPTPDGTNVYPQARTNWNATQGPYPGAQCPNMTGTPGTPTVPAWTETIVTVN